MENKLIFYNIQVSFQVCRCSLVNGLKSSNAKMSYFLMRNKLFSYLLLAESSFILPKEIFSPSYHIIIAISGFQIFLHS